MDGQINRTDPARTRTAADRALALGGLLSYAASGDGFVIRNADGEKLAEFNGIEGVEQWCGWFEDLQMRGE